MRMRYFFNNHNDNDYMFLYTVGYEETQSGHTYGPTTRSGYMLHYVHSGSGTFWSGGKRYELKKGDFFFIEPQAIVSYKADEQHPWTYYWIGFKGSLVTEYLTRTAISMENPVFSVKNGGDLIKEKISEMIEISFISEDNDLLLNARLMEILFYLSQSFPAEAPAQTSSNKLFTQALQIMRNNYDSPIQIGDIADSLAIDRTYLHRIFKQEMNVSPKEYLTGIRISQAKELLLQTDWPVKVIAQSVGFDDPQRFSHTFKQREQQTPNQYRRNKQQVTG
nr:AraC family transcriptional regulator [uncultured Trichococcus sp.]